MSRRKDPKAPPRPYYRFPWPAPAITYAVHLATLHENQKGTAPVISPITYRTIAAELRGRGFVDRAIDPATVRRLVVSQIGARRAAR